MLELVISGGQTGVDQAALRAAKYNSGLATGGWAPKGYRTQAGSMPWLRTEYGLNEHDSPDYPPRTEANVLWADFTLRIARIYNSPGERLTLKYIVKHSKPQFSIALGDDATEPKVLRRLVRQAGLAIVNVSPPVRILNVAGNSEYTAPGITDSSYKLLVELFRYLKEDLHYITT